MIIYLPIRMQKYRTSIIYVMDIDHLPAARGRIGMQMSRSFAWISIIETYNFKVTSGTW
jgi:hypothetical protein